MRTKPIALVGYLALAILISLLLLSRGNWLSPQSVAVLGDKAASPKTLIAMAYTECGEMCIRNLQYFTRVGIHKHDQNDYFIVSNGPCSYCKSDEFKQRLQYSNVKLIERENIGYDFGAYSAAIQAVNVDLYKYFVFFNAGMRGPFVPRNQLKDIKDWPNIFTSLLTDKVKLVGTSISCQEHIHVQSFFFALDLVGLKLLREKGVFRLAESDIHELVRCCELGSTRHMFEAGYTVDSLNHWSGRYNWTKMWLENRGTNGCNDGINPSAQFWSETVGNWYRDSPTVERHQMSPLLTTFTKIGGNARLYSFHKC